MTTMIGSNRKPHIVLIDIVDNWNRRIRILRATQPNEFDQDTFEVWAGQTVLSANSTADSALITLSKLLTGTDPWGNSVGGVAIESCYDPNEVRDINGKTIG
jgi:hypothetical protein